MENNNNISGGNLDFYEKIVIFTPEKALAILNEYGVKKPEGWDNAEVNKKRLWASMALRKLAESGVDVKGIINGKIDPQIPSHEEESAANNYDIEKIKEMVAEEVKKGKSWFHSQNDWTQLLLGIGIGIVVAKVLFD